MITEQEVIDEAIREAQEIFTGWTDEIEPIFESILPLYLLSAKRPDKQSKWKIVNRETGEEFTRMHIQIHEQ